MDLQLSGKTALITGATGGIGLEIARVLAAEGASVVIPGRNKLRLEAAVKTISLGSEGRVRGIEADTSTAAGAAVVAEELPEVDILINNLGIYEVKPFAEIPDEDWLRYFEINVMGGIRLSRAYLPGMLKRDWGRIIFISSESGLMTPSVMAHYGMTKTAQLAVSRGLANETSGTGVTVNAVLPGPTRSDASIGFLRSLSSNPEASDAQIESEFFKTHRSMSLLQRLILPDEIADLVAFVSSPRSAATNGAAIRADGGVIPTIA
ncbi:YvaG [Neorhizobium galegae bv. orientalis]|nr:YvaG [Neorhizobium galegae bv. orientalis]